MIKLKPHLKTYIQQALKSHAGITLKKDKALYVKVSKMINGEEVPLSKTINLGIDNSSSDAEVKKAYSDTLVQALGVLANFKQQLDDPNFFSFRKKQALGDGTLEAVFDMMFVKQWGLCSEGQQKQVRIFFADVKEFFGADCKLSKITEDRVFGYPNNKTNQLENGFVQWVARKIAERPKNMTGSVSNSTINKRLGIIRMIQSFAIGKRLLSSDQLINPDPRVKNLGIKNLPKGQSKRKPAFRLWEQEQFLKVIEKSGDQFWYDHWAFAFDLGMRHKGELDSFTIDNVDFGRKTITFSRPKTKQYSVETPLPPRALKILKRRLPEAQKRDDRKVFPTTAGSRIHNWYKYIERCNFNKHFTPYTTRHTYITQLAEEGVNPKVAMELAGHKVIETTLSYYTKSSSKTLEDAMMRLHNARQEYEIDTAVEENSMIGHNSKVRKELK